MYQNIYDNKQFFDEYQKMRNEKLNANELLEIPTMKSMLPNVKDKKILDLGCGSGGMSRYFIENGAKSVVALDISQNMIAEAKKFDCTNITYKILPMEEINKIDDKFDLIFSSLAFHYVKDFNKLIKDCNNLLNEKGILLFSQEHPIVTATIPGKDMQKHFDKDNKRYSIISDYNIISERYVDWNVKDVIKYHRNFEIVINTILNNGFALLEIQESKPNDKTTALVPKYAYQKDRPYFLFVKAQKK